MVLKVYWALTTPKLLILEWLHDQPILSTKVKGANYNGGINSEKQALSHLLCRAFFQQLYFNSFFHVDPHQSNIFYLEDGCIALLDCGILSRFDPKSQQHLTELLLGIIDLDAQRCTQLTLQMVKVDLGSNLAKLENNYSKILRKYYNLSLSEINLYQVFYDILKLCCHNKIKLPSNLGLFSKTLANLEGIARSFYFQLNLLDEIKPLMTDLFCRQLLGDDLVQTFLRTAIDLKNLSLKFPRELDLFLDRLTSETLKWNLTLQELNLCVIV